MKTLKTNTGTTTTNGFQATLTNWLHMDIVLNVGFAESMERGIVALFVPWPFLLLGHDMLILAAPIMFYLFISALAHFCFLRYVWQHWSRHLPEQRSAILPPILTYL